MTAAVCPNEEQLNDFRLGWISEQEIAQLEKHLLTCSSCLNALGAHRSEDDFFTAFRTQGQTRRATNPRLEALRVEVRARLHHMRDSSVKETGTLGATMAPLDRTAFAPPASNLAALLAPPQMPDELGRLGAYRILEMLGSGGMGVVYKAEDPSLQRLVALKVMLPSLASNSHAKERFLREARAMAALTHDNIAAVYQVGEDRAIPFLAMPLLQGEPLEQRLVREPCLPLSEAMRIARETALGLAAAHERGMIHRDIKPANLWLESRTGRVKILDFGLARGVREGDANLTKEGTVLGTPAYMAPEQAGGDGAVDARADLFSLGCVLYRMTTGRSPFEGKNMMEVLRNVAVLDPRPPHEVNQEIAPEVSKFMLRLLAKDRNERPVSAGVVARVLETLQQKHAPLPVALPLFPTGNALREDTVLETPAQKAVLPSLPQPASTRFRLSRRHALIAAAATILLLLGGWALTRVIFPTKTNDERAQRNDDDDERGENDGKIKLPSRELPRRIDPRLQESLPPIVSGQPFEDDSFVRRPARIERVDTWTLQTRATETKFAALELLPGGLLALQRGSRAHDYFDFNQAKLVPAPLGIDHTYVAPDQTVYYSLNATKVDLAKPGSAPLTLTGHAYPVSDAHFSPDGAFLATFSTVELVFWQVKDSRKAGTWQPSVGFPITSIRWSRDSKSLLLIDGQPNDKFVRVIDRATQKVQFSVSLVYASAQAWSPTEELLAVHDSDRCRIYDLRERKLTHTFKYPVEPAAAGMAWSSDGAMFAYVGRDRNVLLFDMTGAEPKLLQDFRGHGKRVYGVTFAPDGRTLISSSEDGTVRFWNMEEKDEAKKLRGALIVTNAGWFAISPEGHYDGLIPDDKIFYKVVTETGETVQQSPKEFKDRFGWKNDPNYVRLIDYDAYKKRMKPSGN